MLHFLVLCTFLQTLCRKSLAHPLAPSSGVAANIIAPQQCPAAPENGQQLRSVHDIVQSCLFTIFACIWTSIHPNINGSRDSWWTCVKRKVVTTLCAVIAPEVVLLWALRQRFSAQQIAERYNKEFKTLEETEVSIWAKFRQLFQPLPKYTTRRGPGLRQPWTITHGFFIQMGGFILYENEYPKETLTYDRLADLLQKEVIDAPTVTDRDLQDKSKGDTISKGIVVLQTSWFVLQCIVRATQHLPLSELEVLALAFAIMNAAIYAAWWGKPQGVDVAICVPLKHVGNRADTSHLVPASSGPANNQHSNNQLLVEPNEDINEKDSWLRHILWKDHKNHSSLVFLLVRLPYRVTLWVIRPFSKLCDFDDCREGHLRLPMFYVRGLSTPFPEYIACIIGMIFGAIHLFGWTLEFPLPHNRILWQISAVVLTMEPFALLLGALPEQGMLGILRIMALLVYFVLVPFYIVARFVVIAIACKAILHPPHNVLLDISWTRYIPHF